MARAAAVLCALVGVACSDNPYVIGRVTDAGVDECAAQHAAALLCSGFEAPALSSGWDDTMIMNGGVLARSSTRAHHGRAALRASSSAKMSVAVVSKDFPALLSGELYLRLYAYVARGLPTRTMNILFVGQAPEPDPFVGIDFNLENGAVQVYSPQATPMRQTGTSTIPRDRWFCFRARIAISDDHGSVQAFVDDTLALDATNIDTLPPEGVHKFRAGIDWSSQQADFFEIYLDDIVLDTAEVSCR